MSHSGHKTGGLAEIIKDGQTGLLANPNRPEELARDMLILIKSKRFRRELSWKAYRQVIGNFSDEQMVKETVALYKEL